MKNPLMWQVKVPLYLFVPLSLLACLGLLCAVSVFTVDAVLGDHSGAREAVTRSSLSDILCASRFYQHRFGQWPAFDLPFDSQSDRWLEAQLTDSWGVPFVSRIVGDQFYLISAGPDGVIDTADDIQGWISADSWVHFSDDR
ncbi:MAG: hypothetical protein LBW77_06720 [Verrucomicrobiota bacterium]|jgi:hypothetical protein|nr:hypothetical protein [Verrucomicrobiota bacterium]